MHSKWVFLKSLAWTNYKSADVIGKMRTTASKLFEDTQMAFVMVNQWPGQSLDPHRHLHRRLAKVIVSPCSLSLPISSYIPEVGILGTFWTFLQVWSLSKENRRHRYSIERNLSTRPFGGTPRQTRTQFYPVRSPSPPGTPFPNIWSLLGYDFDSQVWTEQPKLLSTPPCHPLDTSSKHQQPPSVKLAQDRLTTRWARIWQSCRHQYDQVLYDLKPALSSKPYQAIPNSDCNLEHRFTIHMQAQLIGRVLMEWDFHI